MVLLHELGHVSRRDLWTSLTARVACLVHWLTGVGLILLVLTVLENLWLRPGLSARTFQIINGQPTEPSMLHAAYIGSQLVKTIALAAVSLSPDRAGAK